MWRLLIILLSGAAFSAKMVRADEGHWAFHKPERPRIPARHDDVASNAVDAFVNARLEAAGLKRSAAADDRTFMRRTYLNVIGLLPTFEEVQAFETSSHPNKHERLIDRLLASSPYGERWARHWLDVARYSDTKGYAYAGEEFNFVHAWLYRDWVVDALNADLSYDDFVVKQLAADRLVATGQAQKKDLAAMGFLTLGRRFLGVEPDIIDDRIDVVTRGLLGLTVACARCHDHKFDPVPTSDYYALYSIFKSSSKALTPVRSCADPELAKRRKKLEETLRKASDESIDRFIDRLEEYLIAALDLSKVPKPDFSEIIGAHTLNPAQVRRWYEFLSQEARRDDPVFAPWKALAEEQSLTPGSVAKVLGRLNGVNRVVIDAIEEAAPLNMEDVARCYARVLKEAHSQQHQGEDWKALTKVLRGEGSPIAIPQGHVHAVEWLFHTDVKRDLNAKQAELERRILALGKAAPHAVILKDRPVPIHSAIFNRGDYASQGAEAPRRFLTVLNHVAKPIKPHTSGRLSMARAIVDPDNPLTARVIVNRLWHHHFGIGLVRTTSDFGLRSESPSHPDLLDYLASELVHHGWSLKSIHRAILTSSLYQRATKPEADPSDPENRLLSFFPSQRLAFETMRDALLQASGELEQEMGGPPKTLFGEKASPRRALYGKIDRQFLPKSLQVFDFPNPEMHSPRRAETSVPQQALFFLNSPFIQARARALAARVAAEIPENDLDARVRRLYEIVYQRPPTASQMYENRAFLVEGKQKDTARDREELDVWERHAQALLLSNEFLFVD